MIVSINGTHVRDSGSLQNAVGLLRPGRTGRVGLIRDGHAETVTAVLGAAPDDRPAERGRPAPPQEAQLDPAFEGAELADSDATQGRPGLLVTAVEPGSAGRRTRPAARRHHHQDQPRYPCTGSRKRSSSSKNARSIILEVQRGNRSQLILMR